MKIKRVRAMEILDSRGNPTVQAEVLLANGMRASAQVPSGASTGTHEALELRDGDPLRYCGKGVRRAVEQVERLLAPRLVGMDVRDQQEIDRSLTEEQSILIGANATLAVSCATARAAALSEGVPLWRYLAGPRKPLMPVPMVNIISGGLHAGRNIEFQDFLVVPRGYPDLDSSLNAIAAVHRATLELLQRRDYTLTGVADEGGWGPHLRSNREAVEILREAITDSGASMDIAIDVASTHFYFDGQYRLEDRSLTAREMCALLENWIDAFGVVSFEDPLAEDDWEGWREITAAIGTRVRLIGDDLFVTNSERLGRGVREGIANSVLVKMNQIGTISQTLHVIGQARDAGYAAVISARSGETEDSFLADLAVASGAGQIKIGSITRSERLAKYNRLLEIERWELSD